jgi:hypothetical protein
MVASTKVRPLPVSVRSRLDKLMLMLGSSNEGERAAAAGLINNLLKENGLDWHDVVGSIGQPAPSAPKPPPRNPVPMPVGHEITADELKRLVHLILRSPLNKRAREFLAGMMDRANIYDLVFLSDKQWIWLRDLARRAGAI